MMVAAKDRAAAADGAVPLRYRSLLSTVGRGTRGGKGAEFDASDGGTRHGTPPPRGGARRRRLRRGLTVAEAVNAHGRLTRNLRCELLIHPANHSTI